MQWNWKPDHPPSEPSCRASRIHAMELKVRTDSMCSTFLLVLSRIHAVELKDFTSKTLPYYYKIVWIHAMELKGGRSAGSRRRAALFKWIHAMELKVLRKCTIVTVIWLTRGIHAMELKGPPGRGGPLGWNTSRIHSMELKGAICSTVLFSPPRSSGIHSMELKEELYPGNIWLYGWFYESIQWNWKEATSWPWATQP